MTLINHSPPSDPSLLITHPDRTPLDHHHFSPLSPQSSPPHPSNPPSSSTSASSSLHEPNLARSLSASTMSSALTDHTSLHSGPSACVPETEPFLAERASSQPASLPYRALSLGSTQPLGPGTSPAVSTRQSGPLQFQLMDSPLNTQSLAPPAPFPMSPDEGPIRPSPLISKGCPSQPTGLSAHPSRSARSSSPVLLGSTADPESCSLSNGHSALHNMESPSWSQPFLNKEHVQVQPAPSNSASHSQLRHRSALNPSHLGPNMPSSSSPAPSLPRQCLLKRFHVIKPSPLHPLIQAQKHAEELQVKETLDAQSSLSQDGEKQINQYVLKKELGRGSFGAVQLAIDSESGKKVAIKEFSKQRLLRKKMFKRFSEQSMANDQNSNGPDALFLIRNEVAIMKRLSHPNVVRLYEVLDVEGEDSLYMVMEYCEGGSLLPIRQDQAVRGDRFEGLGHDLARRYFRQLIVGIDYLHQNQIIHHDIKPDNILLSADRKQVKIADFGISVMFFKPGDQNPAGEGSMLNKAMMGSPAFCSPELLLSADSPSTSVQPVMECMELVGDCFASDIWAMGVTLYCMLTGRLPFGEGQLLDVCEAILHEAPVVPNDWDVSLVELISRLLDKDPKTRIKMKELRCQDWVTDCNKLPKLVEPQQKIELRVSQSDMDQSFKIGRIYSSLLSMCPHSRCPANYPVPSPYHTISGLKKKFFRALE